MKSVLGRSGTRRWLALAQTSYGAVGQTEDGHGATERARSEKRFVRDALTLVRMIRLINADLENSLHGIGMRGAALVRMLQTAMLRARKDGRCGDSGFTSYFAYEAFLKEAGRIRASLWGLLKYVFTEQAVVETISEKYFFGKPILFREKERHLARTITWLLAVIDEYNAIVPQKSDASGPGDDCMPESKTVASKAIAVCYLDPEEVQAAISPGDCRQQVRLVETAALCQSLAATDDGTAAKDILASRLSAIARS